MDNDWIVTSQFRGRNLEYLEQQASIYQRWGLAEALHLHYRLSALVLDENKPPDIHHVPSGLVLIPLVGVVLQESGLVLISLVDPGILGGVGGSGGRSNLAEEGSPKSITNFPSSIVAGNLSDPIKFQVFRKDSNLSFETDQ